MISVIIAAHNADRWFEECLHSIQAQSFSDFEVIVVDDGSTDQTLAQAQRFARNDARFRTIAKPHTNAGDARNVGLAEATGDYLLFFDADDRMMPTMLGTLYRKAVKNDADVVVCDAEDFQDKTDAHLRVSNPSYTPEFGTVFSAESAGSRLFQLFSGWPWDKLFKRSFIEEHGLQFQSLTSTNDAYFVFMALVHAKRIYCTREVLVQHRKRAGSTETSRHATPHNAKLAVDAIRKDLQGLPNRSAFMQSFDNWALIHTQWNYRSLEGQARAEALNDFIEEIETVGPQEPGYYYSADPAAAASALFATKDYKAALVDAKVQAAIEHIEFNDERNRAWQETQRLTAALETSTWHHTDCKNRLAQVSQQLSDESKLLAQERGQKQELLSSSSWKVGHALMSGPHKVKETLKSSKRK